MAAVASAQSRVTKNLACDEEVVVLVLWHFAHPGGAASGAEKTRHQLQAIGHRRLYTSELTPPSTVSRVFKRESKRFTVIFHQLCVVFP